MGSARHAGALALLAAAAALVAPTAAQARSKRLAPPYRNYELVLTGTTSAEGTEVTSFTPGPGGGSRCDSYVSTNHGTGSRTVHVVYRLSFGRLRVRGGRRFGVVWHLAHHTGSVDERTTLSEAVPDGCPPPDPEAVAHGGGPGHGTCTHSGRVGVFPIGFEVGPNRKRTSHGQRFGAALDLDWEDDIEDQCSGTGNPFFDHYQGPARPLQASILFTDRGVLARKTFHGSVGVDQLPNGSGTDPQSGTRSRNDWSLHSTANLSFVLKPVR